MRCPLQIPVVGGFDHPLISVSSLVAAFFAAIQRTLLHLNEISFDLQRMSKTYSPCPCGSIRIQRESQAETISIPDKNLTETTGTLSMQELFSITELNVHVRVDRDQKTSVFSSSPLETDPDILVDAVCSLLATAQASARG